MNLKLWNGLDRRDDQLALKEKMPVELSGRQKAHILEHQIPWRGYIDLEQGMEENQCVQGKWGLTALEIKH